jgi:4'-phosphopantetheinyl transferase
LRLAKRRADWRLGRWAAKRAVSETTGLLPTEIELLAAPDGAPEAHVGDRRISVSVSWSHRAGRAMAAVVRDPVRVGVDLELLEGRSGAFVREWFSSTEQDFVGADDVLRANLLWTAKEAASKVWREGLRRDPRSMSVAPTVELSPAVWSRVTVSCSDTETTPAGWWRVDSRFVVVVLTDVPTPPPAGPLHAHRDLRGETPVETDVSTGQ